MNFDCFTYNGEWECLEIRLNELDHVVDRWVLSEGCFSQIGNPKPFYFDRHKQKFRKFLHKIIHVKVWDFPRFADEFKRDRHQRNSLMRGFKPQDHDIVTLGDSDEIPRPEVYAHFKKNLFSHHICSVNMRLRVYALNGVVDEPWTFPKVMSGWLWNTTVPEEARHWSFMGGANIPTIDDGGYHLSWIGGLGACFRKLNANMIPTEWGKGDIHDQLRQGILPNPDRGSGKKVTLTDGDGDPLFYPRYVRDNLESFKLRGLIAPLPTPPASTTKRGNGPSVSSCGSEGEAEHRASNERLVG